MTDFLPVDPSVALNIHLCHAGCYVCYIRNTFLFAPSTTSLLVTIIGASIDHNYIFSCFFVCLFCFHKQLFSSPYMSLDKRCDRCQRNVPEMKACEVLHPVKVVPKVWCLVGIDLIGAPTTSQNGNRFLLSRRCKRPLYKLCDNLSCVKQRCGVKLYRPQMSCILNYYE